jgi:hypothetical protein
MKKSDTIKKLKGKQLVTEMRYVKLTIDLFLFYSIQRKNWGDVKMAKIGLKKAERLLKQFEGDVK